MSACRHFEEHLAAEMDALLSGSAGPGHAGECPACASLLERLRENALLLERLVRPEPVPGFLARLAAPPDDFAARREATAVLALLEPGALAAPAPSPELLSRLAFLPTRAKAEREAVAAAPHAKGRLARLFADWRVTVAFVYGVLFVVVAVLRVDPMSVARGAASDLTATGERVLGDARTAAVARLERTHLTKRLDYRVYKAVTATRARASAYAQLIFEKVTGSGSQETTAAAVSRSQKKGRRPSREPARSVLRSSSRTPLERVERT